MYGVLTCDLAGSRSLTKTERQAATTRIRTVVEHLCRTLPGLLGTGFEFRFGDEWQLLLDRPDQCYTVYSHLYYRLQEYPFYCGIGVGHLMTEPATNSHEADGPAFHLARAALETAKHARSRVCIRFPAELQLMEEVAQSMADLLAILRAGRRSTQVEVCQLGILGGLPVTDIAAQLGVERTAISHRARSAGLREEQAALDALEKVLRFSLALPGAGVSYALSGGHMAGSVAAPMTVCEGLSSHQRM